MKTECGKCRKCGHEFNLKIAHEEDGVRARDHIDRAAKEHAATCTGEIERTST